MLETERNLGEEDGESGLDKSVQEEGEVEISEMEVDSQA